MATSRTTNTMAEGLNGLLSSISEMKTMPDADLQFLITLETAILQKVHSQYDVAGQMAQPTPGGGQMQPPPGMAPPMAGGMPIGAGGGARGMRTEPNMPHPDEIRRMVGASQQ